VDDNRRIFLAPVSNNELYKNYVKTVLTGIPKEVIGMLQK